MLILPWLRGGCATGPVHLPPCLPGLSLQLERMGYLCPRTWMEDWTGLSHLNWFFPHLPATALPFLAGLLVPSFAKKLRSDQMNASHQLFPLWENAVPRFRSVPHPYYFELPEEVWNKASESIRPEISKSLRQRSFFPLGESTSFYWLIYQLPNKHQIQSINSLTKTFIPKCPLYIFQQPSVALMAPGPKGSDMWHQLWVASLEQATTTSPFLFSWSISQRGNCVCGDGGGSGVFPENYFVSVMW